MCLITLSSFRASKRPQFCKNKCLRVFFHQKCSSQNEQSLLFQAFRASKLSKAPTLLKDAFVYIFTTRTVYKMSKVWLFKFFELHGFQKFPLFSKEVKRADYKMSKVYIFELFELHSFQKPSRLSKDVFE